MDHTHFAVSRAFHAISGLSTTQERERCLAEVISRLVDEGKLAGICNVMQLSQKLIDRYAYVPDIPMAPHRPLPVI